MTAKTFRVVGFSNGAINIPHGFPAVRVDRPAGEHVLRLRSEYETDPLGHVIHKRVRTTVDLPAPDLDEALVIGLGFAEEALSVAAFVTGASSGFVKPWVLYDTTPGITERAFRQYVHAESGLPEKVTRSVPVDQFREVYMAKAGLTGGPRWKPLSNAMFWFDRACDETKPVHRYAAMWLALESLEAALAHEFQSEPDYGTCACGERYRKSTAVGLRDLLAGLKNEVALSFGDARDVRVAIFHATDTIFEANRKASEHLAQLETALAHAVCKLLAIEDAGPLTRRGTPLPSRIPYFAVLDGMLYGSDPSSLGIDGEEPYYQLHPLGSGQMGDGIADSGKTLSFAPVPHISTESKILSLTFADELGVRRMQIDGRETG